MENVLNEQTAFTAHTAEAEKDLGAAADGQVSFGKFKDANALLKAYNSLQAEFTKRCQRVKELEGALASIDKREQEETESVLENSAPASFDTVDSNAVSDKADGNNGQTSKAVSKETEAEKSSFSDKVAEKISNGVFSNGNVNATEKGGLQNPKTLPNEQGAGERYFANTAEATPVKDEKEVLKEYLKSVLTSKPTAIIMDGGLGLKTLPKTPKTISEAGALAMELLNNHDN